MQSNEQSFFGVLRDLLIVAVRHRRLILFTYLGILLASVVGIFVVPPEYRAATKILLTTDRAEISTTSDRPTELVRTSQVPDAEVDSQIEILRSQDLVEKVLESLAAPPEDIREGTQPPPGLGALVGAPLRLLKAAYRHLHNLEEVGPSTPLYWESREVLRYLDAARVKKSNVVEVGLTSTDPVWARDFIDRLTHAYVERHAQMLQVANAENFFMKQSEILQRKLVESENQLRQARERAGALAGQQSEIHERLNEFSAELSRTNISRAELEQRVAYLESLQGNSVKRGRIGTPQLLELEAKRAELLGRYRPESERVREIDEQIARLRAAIASYDTITTAQDGSATGGGTDLMSARASLAALRGKEEALERQRDEYRKQAEMLDAQSFDVARLERQVKLDEETYLSYVRTAEQSRLSNALDQSKLLRLSIIEPATVPLEPVSPNKGRIMFFAIVGGLVVSFGAAFARDHFDATLKTPADVRRFSRLEVLAAIPDRS